MLTKALAVAGVMALAATLSPGTASAGAETTTGTETAKASDAQRAGVLVRDRQRRDPTYVRPAFDATAMKVYPRYERGWLGVQVYGPRLLPSRRFNATAVYLQTRGDRRPDYRIVRYFSGDGDGITRKYVARTRSWGSDGVRVNCPRLQVKWNVNKRHVMFWIPRACINRRGEVRVNAETWDLYRYRHGDPTRVLRDGAPRYRTLSRWI